MIRKKQLLDNIYELTSLVMEMKEDIRNHKRNISDNLEDLNLLFGMVCGRIDVLKNEIKKIGGFKEEKTPVAKKQKISKKK